MADIDPELVERAIRWCAEAGRQTTAAIATAALKPLKWDELLAAHALLADPPPARPLGPFALADIARGAPADVAAERERSGRYATALTDASAPDRPLQRSTPGGRKRSRAPFVVRRASERTPPVTPPPRSPPLLDELLLEEGRAVLSRLIRRHGGRRARIVEALASGWRRPDAQPLAPSDLERLLAHHGMAHAFEVRERDEILHALRAAGGVRATAASRLGIDLPALEEALERLGARGDSERVRELRRSELRARGTLTERAHLVLDAGERLADLDLLDEFLQDLRERLPDHVRALGASTVERQADGLSRSLALDARGVERLVRITGLRLDPGDSRGDDAARAAHRPRLDRGTTRTAPGPRTTARTAHGRSDAARPPSGRARPAGRKPQPPGGRTKAGGRPGGGRRPPTRPPKQR